MILKEDNNFTQYNINSKMHGIIHNMNKIIQYYFNNLERRQLCAKKRKLITVQIITRGVTDIIIVVVKIVWIWKMIIFIILIIMMIQAQIYDIVNIMMQLARLYDQ